jgi:flavin-dependent dehydrogenase
MRKQDADVVVAGCGPIGAYACWRFARRGLKVIGLERNGESDPASDIGVFHFERDAFEHSGIPLPADDKVVCRYPGMTVHAPGPGRTVRVEGVETWALDLDGFISDLRNLAAEAGADLRFDKRVTGVTYEEGRPAGVRVEGGGRESTLSATVVVDATGMARAVRRHVPAFSLPSEGTPFSVYMEYWTGAETPPGDGIHSFVGHNAWTARYPGYWIVGIGQPRPMAETRVFYDAWVRRAFPGRKEILRSVTGVIPYAFSPATMVEHGVLLVGDAAATNKPFSGEGISSGMHLVELAAGVLPGAVAAGGSRRALWTINRQYFPDQGAKFAMLRAMGFSLQELDEEDLNAAFDAGLMNGEDLRQTFLKNEVRKPPWQWLGPALRMAGQGRSAWKYFRAVLRATRLARLLKQYPAEDRFPRWEQQYRQRVAAFGSDYRA